jgi:tRNA(Ile)-lysidine synthase TilS/MesJ
MSVAYVYGINPMLKLSEKEVRDWLTNNKIQSEVDFSPQQIGVVSLVSSVMFSSENDMRKFHIDFIEPRRKAMM